jgi:hypothetical protein
MFTLVNLIVAIFFHANKGGLTPLYVFLYIRLFIYAKLIIPAAFQEIVNVPVELTL